ncbi:MAG: hypothetical protein J7L61_00600 [Thermoplasmata archaeon]|nr:hypothetical protein [Thermoplasmata archaeon]
MARILAVFAGGGHTQETAFLVEHLGPSHEYAYAMLPGDDLSPHKRPYPGEIVRVRKPGGWGDSPFSFIWKTAVSLLDSLGAVIRTDPDMVVSVGKDITVPISLAAKFLGKKVVYVETMQKVYTASTAGKILYRFADLFFVQWPEMKGRFPKAIYAGRLV